MMAERRLWIAVLVEQIGLALRERDPIPYAASDEVRGAPNWIGTRHFRDVCMLAGFDPAWVHRMYCEEAARPLGERRAVILGRRSGSDARHRNGGKRRVAA